MSILSSPITDSCYWMYLIGWLQALLSVVVIIDGGLVVMWWNLFMIDIVNNVWGQFYYQNLFVECYLIISIYLIVQYNRQMRYQSKTYRSVSYIQRQSLKDNRENKENKENNNISNLPIQKPHRLNKDYDPLLNKLKLEYKISQSTNTTTVSLNKDQIPDSLKKIYTQLITKDYSSDILNHHCQSSVRRPGILTNHGISSSLRSKMIDWMIEVLSSYKMSEQTFFRSVYLMDLYLQTTKQKLQVKDLHLVGVTSMFSAAKYEQIHPLKLNIIYDKIARKKFKKSEILDKESQIVQTLLFKLESSSVYDIARHIVEQMNISLTETSRKYFSKIVLYLSKMSLFNELLAEESPSLLAAAVVFIGLKTLQQVDSTAEPENRLSEICSLVNCQQQGIIEISRRVLDLAKNFSKYYASLTNLKKFNKFEYGTD